MTCVHLKSALPSPPQEEYFYRHPGGVNPVLLNDVVFSVNAAFAQGLLILQCFVLEVMLTLMYI